MLGVKSGSWPVGWGRTVRDRGRDGESPSLWYVEYCTTTTQNALDDGGARKQSGSHSHMDFDLAPFTS